MVSGMSVSSNVQKAVDAVNAKTNAGRRVPFEYRYGKALARLCGKDFRTFCRSLSWKPVREGGSQPFDDFAYNLERCIETNGSNYMVGYTVRDILFPEITKQERAELNAQIEKELSEKMLVLSEQRNKEIEQLEQIKREEEANERAYAELEERGFSSINEYVNSLGSNSVMDDDFDWEDELCAADEYQEEQLELPIEMPIPEIKPVKVIRVPPKVKQFSTQFNKGNRMFGKLAKAVTIAAVLTSHTALANDSSYIGYNVAHGAICSGVLNKDE